MTTPPPGRAVVVNGPPGPALTALLYRVGLAPVLAADDTTIWVATSLQAQTTTSFAIGRRSRFRLRSFTMAEMAEDAQASYRSIS